MQNCRDVEPLMAPYVDGDAAPDDRAAVDAHTEACGCCRDDVSAQRAARDVLRARRAELRGAASPQLRARCASHAVGVSSHVASGSSGTSPGSGLSRTLRRTVPFAAAATILLALAVVFGLGLNDRVQALAFQMTLDHVKCSRFNSAAGALDPVIAGREWTAKLGWPLTIPSSSAPAGLELRGVRRCGVTDGRVAHLMYRWRGEPLSVYVLPSRAIESTATVERFGHDSVMWTQNGRTYVVLAGATRGRDFGSVVQYMKSNVY